MAPVRAALMQGLWRALYTQDAACAASALRILGKLGGSSRRALLDAQNYTWTDVNKPARSALVAAQQSRLDGSMPPQLEFVVDVQIADRHLAEGSSTLQTAKRWHEGESDVDSGVSATKRPHTDSTITTPPAAPSPTASAVVSPASQSKSTIQTLRLELPLAELVTVAAAHVRQSVPQAADAVPALGSNWADWCAGSGGMSTSAAVARLPHASALEICSTTLVQALAISPASTCTDDTTIREHFARRLETYQLKRCV